MGNLFIGSTRENIIYDATIVIGKTIEDANKFVKYNTVYWSKEDCEVDDKNNRITYVEAQKGYEDIVDIPGLMRLNVIMHSDDTIARLLKIG